MLFIRNKSFYQFKYSKINGSYTINLFFKNESINFYFLYYNPETKLYTSKILYSFDIGKSTEENISILEKLNFYLNSKMNQLEKSINSKIPNIFTRIDKKNSYIKEISELSSSFFIKKPENIIFSNIFISFIFELYSTDTFKNSKEYNKIINNPIFKIFGAKLQYKIYKNSNSSTDFLKKQEKRWINRLFSKKVELYIEYANRYGLLASKEKELENIFTKERIEKLDRNKDADMITLSSSYFLSLLNIRKAFNIVTNNKAFTILCLMGISEIIFFISLFFIPFTYSTQGFLIYIIPTTIILVMFLFFLYNSTIPNKKSYISILLMPRLFFSILISWIALLSSYDLFYVHLHHSLRFFIIFNAIIIAVIALYFYVKSDYKWTKKIKSIIVISIFISMFQGFFIMKYYINDGYIKRAFTNENAGNFEEIDNSMIIRYKYRIKLDCNFSKKRYELISKLPKECNNTSPKWFIHNKIVQYFNIDIYVLFSMFLIPVLFGLILQNVMDDKSILKPLE